MKTGDVIKTPRQRWYEPQHAVLGGSDSRQAAGLACWARLL